MSPTQSKSEMRNVNGHDYVNQLRAEAIKSNDSHFQYSSVLANTIDSREEPCTIGTFHNVETNQVLFPGLCRFLPLCLS